MLYMPVLFFIIFLHFIILQAGFYVIPE